MSLAYNFFVMRWGVVSTLSNQWWMAGAGHLASLRGTGVGHYETAATRSLQRQSCQPKVGLPITHLIRETNRNLLHLPSVPCQLTYTFLPLSPLSTCFTQTHTHTHTHKYIRTFNTPPGPSDVIDPFAWQVETRRNRKKFDFHACATWSTIENGSEEINYLQ